jgi:CHAD domain-containing protein
MMQSLEATAMPRSVAGKPTTDSNRDAAMSTALPEYIIPDGLAIQDIQARLGKQLSIRDDSPRTLRCTYYDTFDWRIHAAGDALEVIANGREASLSLRSRQDSGVQCAQRINDPPHFVRDLPPGNLRSRLEPVVEMRALLPVITIRCRTNGMRVLNKEEKTVLRIVVEEDRASDPEGRINRKLGRRLRLMPVRGYDKAAEKVRRIIEKEMGLSPAGDDLLGAAIAAVGKKPGTYSAKFDLHLEPAMRADAATRLILRSLLETIEVNEEGTREDLDSEFLHDLRVAVRRTRSALTQIKGVLPARAVERYKAAFAWLGQITGPTRDMDVYLLKFDEYRSTLPESIQNDLQPLHQFLQAHQALEHKALVKAMDSARYRKLLEDWRKFLETPLPNRSTLSNAMRPIGDVANERIWKLYKLALKEGRAIGAESPAESLHELRKTCKKLRYLMEFFKSLYPSASIRSLIKTLKVFQDNLGDFQDLDVQVATLRRFSHQMVEEGVGSPETLMAMGILVENLQTRQHQTREAFSERFAEFSLPKNQKHFRELFSPAAPLAPQGVDH